MRFFDYILQIPCQFFITDPKKTTTVVVLNVLSVLFVFRTLNILKYKDYLVSKATFLVLKATFLVLKATFLVLKATFLV